jgi:hypothetical protein
VSCKGINSITSRTGGGASAAAAAAGADCLGVLFWALLQILKVDACCSGFELRESFGSFSSASSVDSTALMLTHACFCSCCLCCVKVWELLPLEGLPLELAWARNVTVLHVHQSAIFMLSY